MQVNAEIWNNRRWLLACAFCGINYSTISIRWLFEAKTMKFRLFIIASAVFFAGCTSYVTPGSKADLSIFSNDSVAQAASSKPAVAFPASIVLARVQGSGYRNYSIDSYGTGKYSIVTVREIEKEEDIDNIQKLVGIAQVGTLNRLLLPENLSSDTDLRQAAAKLHADLLLIYTFSTAFRDRDLFKPLSVITLGLSPTRDYTATATASAILLDVKTGYIYGALEESSKPHEGLSTSWGAADALEDARKAAEREAFEKLVNAFEPFWKRLYQSYADRQL